MKTEMGYKRPCLFVRICENSSQQYLLNLVLTRGSSSIKNVIELHAMQYLIQLR